MELLTKSIKKDNFFTTKTRYSFLNLLILSLSIRLASAFEIQSQNLSKYDTHKTL